MVHHSPELIAITKSLREVLEQLGVTPTVLEEYKETDHETIRVFQGGLSGDHQEAITLGGYLDPISMKVLALGHFNSYALLDQRLIFIPAHKFSYADIISMMTNIHGDFIEVEEDPQKIILFLAFCLLHELGHFKLGGTQSGMSFPESMIVERGCDAGALHSLYKHSVPGLPDFYLDIVRMRAVAAILSNFARNLLFPGKPDQYKYTHAAYLSNAHLAESEDEVVEAHERLHGLLKKNRPPADYFPEKAPLFYHIYLAAFKTLAEEELTALEQNILHLFLEGIGHFAPKSAERLNHYGLEYIGYSEPLPPAPQPF